MGERVGRHIVFVHAAVCCGDFDLRDRWRAGGTCRSARGRGNRVGLRSGGTGGSNGGRVDRDRQRHRLAGGQFSSEALGAIDENRGPQGYDQTTPFPRHGLFKEVIDRIEARNLARYGRARPGNTRVITTCRPADAAAVFEELVAPAVESGRLSIHSGYHAESVDVDPATKRVTTVHFVAVDDPADRLNVTARLTIDASDWGDVIRLSGAGYEFGPDLKSKYGEPLAPEQREGYPLTDMNPITYCLVLRETDDYRPIPRPTRYDPRSYRSQRYRRIHCGCMRVGG
ncbi:MAG: FAD-dependent oxidoreductase [Planctomycetaceae bacterium]